MSVAKTLMHQLRGGRLMWVAAGLLALGLGCGDGTGPPVPVATVSVTPPPPVDLVRGATQLLTAVPKDATGGTLSDRTTTWSSSDPAKVTVVAGLVTGIDLGTATITASVEDRAALIEVRVGEGGVATAAGASFTAHNGAVGVVVPPGALTETKSLTVIPAGSPPPNPRLLPGTAFDFGPDGTTFAQPVTLTIKYDPATVAADSPESGLQLYEVTGSTWRVVAGSSVNATSKTVSGDVTHFSTYAVLMQPRVDTVRITGDLSPVPVTTTRQYTAVLRDNEGLPLTRPVAWTSSNPAVMSIDPGSGLATARIPGTVTITATSETKSGTVTISVVPGPPAKIIADGGNGQAAAAGAAVAIPPSVKVTDASDNPISGVPVSFAVATGGGTIGGASTTTNASGIATVGSWTLGVVAGPNTLVATSTAISGLSVTFTAAGGAGPAAIIAIAGGNNQSGTAGGVVATAPSARVTDANGNSVAGFAVTFAPGSGSGSVTGGAANTNSAGIATVGSWKLGSTPGPQTLTATGSGLTGSPVTFTATAVAPVPSTVAVFAGNGQSARTGLAVATPPAVRVTDAAGVPVPGFAVTFAVVLGGGSITGANATTNDEGVASVGSWVLGPTAGQNTLGATAGSLSGSPVTFTATAVAPIPTVIAINAGDNQTALTGSPVPIRPSVKVTAADGVGVPGVSVTFSIGSGAGSITDANQVTNAQGIATIGSWTLGLGGNSLFASVPGLAGNPVTFVALGQVEVQIVTFGDSNTDLGYEGTDPAARVASYVSSNVGIKLAANAPNSILQLAGKIEARWRASRSATIKAVNHGIASTSTGAGRSSASAPHASEAVGGVTRFQGEVLGVAYPWSGGESVNAFYPTGPISRVQAFTPRTSDFAYISMGTNDIGSVPTTTIRNNLEIMIDQWIGRGLPPGRLMITTIPPRRPGAESASIPDLNSKIRTLAQQKGVILIDIATFTSDGDGLTWKTSPVMTSDQVHYTESVRDWIADQVVSYMLSVSPP